MYKNRKPQTADAIERRIVQKEAELAALQDEATELELELESIAQGDMMDPDKVVKQHIKQLKEYNELKDTALNLIQLIADQRQVRLGVVMDEIGVELDK